MTNSTSVLKEIIHRAVTFTPATLDKDTEALNKAISQGYTINDSVRTDTGIVYVLAKWEKGLKQIPKKSKKSSFDKETLKNCYTDLCKAKTL
jgi:hypothetical protein